MRYAKPSRLWRRSPRQAKSQTNRNKTSTSFLRSFRDFGSKVKHGQLIAKLQPRHATGEREKILSRASAQRS